jgi:hypothetical protein
VLRRSVRLLLRGGVGAQALELAGMLAEQRWLEHAIDQAAARSGGRCLVVTPRPLAHHLIGWWTTTTGGTVPRRGALNEQGRVLVWCEDPTAAHAAGPGIEFRP